MNTARYEKRPRKTLAYKIGNAVGILLCIVMLPLVVINTTLLIQTVISPDVPPNFLGYTPIIVAGDSMQPHHYENDLSIIHNTPEGAAYQTDDIICYQSSEGYYVIHRIVDTETKADGETVYVTKGDHNEAPDSVRVRPEQILGVESAVLGGFGSFMLFSSTPMGMLLCFVLPLLIIVAAFTIPSYLERRKNRAKRNTAKHSEIC